MLKRLTKKIGGYLAFLSGNKKGQRLLLVAGLFFAIYFILILSILPLGVSVELGMPSPQTIYAHREVVDYHATNELREQAAASVPEVYDHDHSIMDEGRETIGEFFHCLREVREKEELETEEKCAVIRETAGTNLSDESLRALVGLSPDGLEELESRAETIFVEIMARGIKEEARQEALKQALQEVGLLPFGPEIRQGMERLFSPLIQPNMIYNVQATEAARDAARQAVEPVRILRNSLIIQEGERVTERHVAQLEALGLLGPRIHVGGFIGLFLILLIVFLALILYLYLFNRDIIENVSYLSLLSLIILVTIILGLAARYFSGYLMPVAMSGILIAVLFEARLAVIVNVILVLLLGFIVDGEFGYIIVALLGGLVAIYSVSGLQRRSDLTKAGIYVSAVNMVSIIAIFLLNHGFILQYDFLRQFSVSVLAGMGNGIFAAVMAIGLLPFLESAFGLTTAVTLLELAEPGRPLLRRLLMETPGTYHHSVMVGNLAEAASEAVGADPLMSRVAAFYHDIGKTRRPYFFVENQFTNENPHNKISPSLSALIIRSHVKDGVEIAGEENLPLPIIDIIKQHHGTGMISFFYQQAIDKDKRIDLTEEEFRYEGPLPQTKEAAIILLADAVEAAVRSLSRPAAGRVEGMVRRIIKEKLNDGQFDEAPLTLRDLDKIGDTFVHMLSGIFHHRIEYPEKEIRADLELERGKNKIGSAGE